MIKVGSRVYTPRFCTVIVNQVFDTKEEAFNNGFKEPTYWDDPEYEIRGKSIKENTMIFAAYKKN